jgi:hypothetical protein
MVKFITWTSVTPCIPKLVKLVHDVTLPIFYWRKKVNDPAYKL